LDYEKLLVTTLDIMTQKFVKGLKLQTCMYPLHIVFAKSEAPYRRMDTFHMT